MWIILLAFLSATAGQQFSPESGYQLQQPTNQVELGVNPFGESILDPTIEEELHGDEIPGEAGRDYPIYAEVPETPFNCQDQPFPGYYADLDAQCQVFHICQERGRKDSFLCPNGTVFNQQYFVCDWWYNFDCASAPEYYSLNEFIGKADDTAESNPEAAFINGGSANGIGNGEQNGYRYAAATSVDNGIASSSTNGANGNGYSNGNGNGRNGYSNGNGNGRNGYSNGNGNGRSGYSNGNGNGRNGYSNGNGNGRNGYSNGNGNGRNGYSNGNGNGRNGYSNGNGNGRNGYSNGNGATNGNGQGLSVAATSREYLPPSPTGSNGNSQNGYSNGRNGVANGNGNRYSNGFSGSNGQSDAPLPAQTAASREYLPPTPGATTVIYRNGNGVSTNGYSNGRNGNGASTNGRNGNGASTNGRNGNGASTNGRNGNAYSNGRNGNGYSNGNGVSPSATNRQYLPPAASATTTQSQYSNGNGYQNGNGYTNGNGNGISAFSSIRNGNGAVAVSAAATSREYLPPVASATTGNGQYSNGNGRSGYSNGNGRNGNGANGYSNGNGRNGYSNGNGRNGYANGNGGRQNGISNGNGISATSPNRQYLPPVASATTSNGRYSNGNGVNRYSNGNGRNGYANGNGRNGNGASATSASREYLPPAADEGAETNQIDYPSSGNGQNGYSNGNRYSNGNGQNGYSNGNRYSNGNGQNGYSNGNGNGNGAASAPSASREYLPPSADATSATSPSGYPSGSNGYSNGNGGNGYSNEAGRNGNGYSNGNGGNGAPNGNGNGYTNGNGGRNGNGNGYSNGENTIPDASTSREYLPPAAASTLSAGVYPNGQNGYSGSNGNGSNGYYSNGDASQNVDRSYLPPSS